MYSIKRSLFPIIVALCTGPLIGCGELLTKPAVPADVPLAPAVIYVPACDKPETGVLSILGAADRAWGEGLCSNLSEALKRRISTENGRYALVNIASEEAQQEFSPDLAVEHSIGARYRVVLNQPRSSRGSALMQFKIIDAKTNQDLVSTALIPDDQGARGASELADKLVSGLNGPRCKPQTSMSFRANAGCETFGLPATH